MKSQFLDLTDNDIKQNKFYYNPQQLEYSIKYNCLSLRLVSKYQMLTPYICAKYVVFGGNNETYGDCSEDRWLDDNDIIERQPHITQEELSNAHEFVLLEEERENKELICMSKEDSSNLFFYF
jgi:hypothetical protein